MTTKKEDDLAITISVLSEHHDAWKKLAYCTDDELMVYINDHGLAEQVKFIQSHGVPKTSHAWMLTSIALHLDLEV
jgi:hypothetical protein